MPLHIALDSTLIHFGVHRGKAISEVPPDYLLWWFGEGKGEQSLASADLHGALARYIDNHQDILEAEANNTD